MMDTLSRYSIKKKICSGGMATIFLAEDTVLKREVAIKKVHPHLLERPETIKRFNNEAKIVASLSHENIITVFDYGENNGEHYIVMEYIDGFTLMEVVEKYGAIPSLVFLNILIQILSGLGSAHAKGIYHRDIKPENMILDQKGIVHITDFGIAHLVNEESITLTGSFVGSPNYISPEQVSGKNITEKTDMFSLGGLCYVCVTGNVPFPADNPSGVLHKVMNEEPISPYQQNRVLIQWVSEYIMKCLQKDPQNRPDTRESLAVIKGMCSNDNLILERERYCRFIHDPEKYCLYEKRELFEIYRNNAHNNYRNKKFVAALKNLDQLQSFDLLSKDELRMKKWIIYRGKINSILISVIILSLIISGAFFAFRRLYQGKNTSEISEKIKQNDTIALQPVEKQAVIIDPDTVTKTGIHPAIVRKKNEKLPDPAIILTPEPDGVKDGNIISTVYGYFDLRTNPPWVKVFIDDIIIGETPKIGIILLKTGEHKVALEKNGFRRIEFIMLVNENDTINKRIKMEPLKSIEEP